MEKYTLKNGIKTEIKKNNNTPRTAIVMYSKLNKDEEKAGLYYLLTQMLFQGTKNKTQEEIANELDENAIELTVEKKADYIRFKLLCLNEDINKALEILQDILENSTFNGYKKEILKIKGEFESDLDSAKVQAQDEYYRTIFKNHPYGTGRKEVIEQIDSVTKKDLISAFKEIKYNSQKNITVVGDVDREGIIKMLEKHLESLSVSDNTAERAKVKKLKKNVISIIEKEDANQAQIFKGWIFPSVYSEDYPKIILLNTILGSSGLSSRLFLELREKQGLAYTVRSIFEPFTLIGNFFVYIATEPKNIKTSLNGFEKEINKIMTEIISDEELENAKNNAIGKRQFYSETNLLEASLKGYYEFLGLGFDFEDKLIDSIKTVTKEDIINTAKKYFAVNNALCVLAPKKYLKEAGLLK
ncbi:MAG: insulinase family protein [Candidatus Gastranaerophilales bacterium]|nr:insulinase family protein [Candidatus Gastranaerophilales bacterium]